MRTPFRKLFFILVLLLGVLQFSAQNPVADSLKIRFNKEVNPKLKTEHLIGICAAYFDEPNHTTNFDSLKKYFQLLSTQFGSYLNRGDSILFYGKLVPLYMDSSATSKQKFATSISYYERSIPFFIKENRYSRVGEAFLQIGVTKTQMSNGITKKNSSSIVPYYNKAVSAFERANDTKNLLGTYLELQLHFSYIGDQYFSDLYLQKAYDLSKLIHDDYEQANILALIASNASAKALGTIDMDIINIIELPDESKKQLNYAIDRLKLSLPLWVKAKALKGHRYSLNELAYSYCYLQNKDSALHYAFLLLREVKKVDSPEDLASCYGTCGDVYHSFKDYDHALLYMDSCYYLSKSKGLSSYIRDLSANYAKIYAIKKDYEKAFQYQQLFIQLNDSLSTFDLNNSTAELQTKYETEKKEGQINSLNMENKIKDEENTRQKIFTIGSVLIGIIILFFALFIFRSLQQNKKKNVIIAQQKLLVEEKHKEITDSINYAERIQRSFLASKELLNENLKEYFVLFLPKDVVSGDFYWATKLKNGNFLMATADSTGHGVPGSIMSILNISCLEKSVEELSLVEPAEILNHTRTKIIERLKKDGSETGGKDGMDCSLISLDPGKTKLNYAAANNPVWIVRNKELLEFAPDKMPVGKHDKDSVSFTQHEVLLEKGDLIYTLTDGFPDQFGGPKGKKFMYKKLKELLVGISDSSLEQQKEILTATLSEWKGSLEQVDDICIIGIRV